MSIFSSVREKLRPILQSPWFMIPVFAGAALSLIYQAPIEGTIGFVLLICALLVLSDNTALTLLPFSLLCMFVLKEYDSFDRFIKLWWLAIPVIPSLLFHLIAYREKAPKNILLSGLIGVAIAITLGGLGSISAAEYFTGANLYYVAGLGIVMVLMHLLISSKYHDKADFHIQDHLCLVFYLIGVFGVFMLFQHYGAHWDEILSTGKLPEIQWSNNLSTFLMIAMPFGFYFSRKNALHMVTTLLMFAAMLLSGSRAPLIFGVAEYYICVIVFTVIDRKRWYVYLLPAIALTIAACIFHEPILLYYSDTMELSFIFENEARFQMALRSWNEFRSNPLFGSGLGATDRQDIYNPVKFAMNWYHSAPFQIFGSLGIVGILAYLYLWYTRVKVFLAHRTIFGYTVMLSQIGLFLMSMVNPGFFCPFPYEFFMVMMFAVLANQKSQTSK